jgi:hypothetical protein
MRAWSAGRRHAVLAPFRMLLLSALANLAIEANQFDFVINLITAKALGLDVSPTLLARTDKVIE